MNTLALSIIVLVSIIAIIILTSRLKLNAFIALFIVSLFLAVSTLPPGKIISTLKEGFGGTMTAIGLLIIFGAMIGVILDRTGATYSMARYILSKTGTRRSAAALGITGFLTGMPIFCDSGFIVLSGLAKSFSRLSGLAMPFLATVLATSLYSVHCLIPPHPGATAAVAVMGADPGRVIVMGIILAIPGALSAFFWSRWLCSKKNYPPAPQNVPGISEEREDLPSPFLSFLPIVVPLLLITLRSLSVTPGDVDKNLTENIIMLAGEPVVALFAGVLLALLLIRKKSFDGLNKLFSGAIEKAGPILIVTAAGGMFGAVIKATGIGEIMGSYLAGINLGLLVPFIIAFLLKTAQGSSTVAIITTASLVEPMLAPLGLGSEWGRLFAVLSMGAGSMIVSHANDSYFWVISNFAGIDTDTNLRVYSTSTIVMGSVIFMFIWMTSLLVI